MEGSNSSSRRRRGYPYLLTWVVHLILLHIVWSQEDLCKPSFGYEKFETIDEDTEVDTVILTVNSAGSSDQVNLTLQDNDYFGFNATTRELYVKKALDADVPGDTTNVVRITCKEADNPPVAIVVMISLKDINDNPPKFEKDHFYVDVSETTSVGQSFDSTVRATDADKSFLNRAISYTIAEGNYSDYFQFSDTLDPEGLVLLESLDFETLPNLTITVVATNEISSSVKLNSTALLTIRVKDEDDLNPVFSRSVYEGVVLETAPINTLVNVTPVIHATDADVTLDEPVLYSFHDQLFLFDRDAQGSRDVFSINNETAEVRLIGSIQPTKVSIVVQATQRDNPSRYGVAMLVITVVGVNSNAPKFQNDLYQVYVSEAVPLGTTILFVSATDKDFGATIRYSIVGDNKFFAVSAESGAINVTGPLDYETARTHNFSVRASDGIMESTTIVEVKVVDANDNPPVIPDQKLSFNTSRDNESVITKIQALDADAGTKLNFKLINYKNLFSIDEFGNLRIAADATALTNKEYLLVVVITDDGNPPREKSVVVTVKFPPLTPTTPSTIITTPTTSSSTTATTKAPVVMAAAAVTIGLAVVAAVLLVVVVILIIIICRRTRNQNSEQLDKAKVNRSPDPRGLKFKNANRPTRMEHIHFQGDDSLDGGTTVQENPLTLKEGGAFNHGFIHPDAESDRNMDEIHIETAVIPYQAADAYNNNSLGAPTTEMFQQDDSSEYDDTLPRKHALMNGLYPDTSSESLNTSNTNSSAEGAKQLLMSNGVTSFGTTSFGKPLVVGGSGGNGIDPTAMAAISMEGINPDVSVAPQEQKSELTVYF